MRNIRINHRITTVSPLVGEDYAAPILAHYSSERSGHKQSGVVILNRVVHLVDGEASHRRSLARALRHEGLESFAYASGEDLIEATGYILPGCVIIVARPPHSDQSALIRILLAARPDMVVIAMGAEPSIALAVQALRAGAVDFLDLACPPTKLRAALDYAFDILPEKVAHQRFIGEAIALKSRLTPREQDVLKGIVAGHTNRMIAHALGIGIRTVEMHRSNIMQKLHMDNIVELIRFAVLSGIAHPSGGTLAISTPATLAPGVGVGVDAA